MKNLSLKTISIFGFGLSMPILASAVILYILFIVFGIMTPFGSKLISTMGTWSAITAIVLLSAYYIDYKRKQNKS